MFSLKPRYKGILTMYFKYNCYMVTTCIFLELHVLSTYTRKIQPFDPVVGRRQVILGSSGTKLTACS